MILIGGCYSDIREKKKVFCKDCKWFKISYDYDPNTVYRKRELCTRYHIVTNYDPIYGEIKTKEYPNDVPSVRNKDFGCTWYDRSFKKKFKDFFTPE